MSLFDYVTLMYDSSIRLDKNQNLIAFIGHHIKKTTLIVTNSKAFI